ncbi:putative ribonuclease H protein [Corchorus olitorius]|uniref:Ribonuclease H protein n=1 Tax=Corchorus olitorius TaxID=93759 RepID=A0A1R3IGE1_9ROSI|nr:putative ribonuclease H protein [Corchorus olitorius]
MFLQIRILLHPRAILMEHFVIFQELDKDGETGKWMKILVVYTCWGIWKARCTAVIGHKQDGGDIIAKRIKLAFSEWHESLDRKAPSYCSLKPANVSNEENSKWTKPANGWIKVNCDCSLKSQTSCIGIVARDSQSRVLKACGKFFRGFSPEIAEAKAVKEGLTGYSGKA